MSKGKKLDTGKGAAPSMGAARAGLSVREPAALLPERTVIALRDHEPLAPHRPALPEGHSAQIVFFTGVQIIRDGSQG